MQRFNLIAGNTLAPALAADEQKAAQVMQLYFEELRKSWSSKN